MDGLAGEFILRLVIKLSQPRFFQQILLCNAVDRIMHVYYRTGPFFFFNFGLHVALHKTISEI